MKKFTKVTADREDGPAMEPDELWQWGMNISYYLIENGPVLKDGDTIGVSDEAMFRIRHVPSSYGHEGRVMRFAAASWPVYQAVWRA